jgi:hypothetical protein
VCQINDNPPTLITPAVIAAFNPEENGSEGREK